MSTPKSRTPLTISYQEDLTEVKIMVTQLQPQEGETGLTPPNKGPDPAEKRVKTHNSKEGRGKAPVN
jgi:hypothetical protein